MSDKTDDKSKGRDEMNIVEFPISLLRHENFKGDVKKLEFSQCIKNSNGTLLKRDWTITSASDFGFPTSSAEDTLVALLEIAKEFNNFSDRTVHFKRKQLLEKMGCPTNNPRYYDRIKKDLNRLTGLLITTQNSFWDNKKKSYSSQAFHIIDDYLIQNEPKRKLYSKETFPLSYFRFGEVFFQSLQAGYVKKLDTHFYFSLKYPLSKKLFRILDKRKYFSDIVEFDLFDLAFEKLGMSRTYDKGQIARNLEEPHQELVVKNFLKDHIYKKEWSDIYSANRWTISYYLIPKAKEIEPPKTENKDPLISALVKEGVSENTAKELVRKHKDRVEKQLEYFYHLRAIESHLISNNPAGFLVSSIRKDYVEPVTRKKKREEEEKAKKEAKVTRYYQQKDEEEEEKWRKERDRWNQFFENLPSEEKKGVMEEALKMLENRKITYQQYQKELAQGLILSKMSAPIVATVTTFRNQILQKKYPHFKSSTAS